jgi:glutamyl-tRNA synthetase
LDDELKRLIKKVALQNAFEHDGQTKNKIVLSKILGTRSELRNKIKEINAEISAIVSNVNNLSLQQQHSEIEKNFPELLATKEKTEERVGLPPLDGAEHGKVVTRFPPEPNGYPHIGHAKAAIIDEEYARMYDGKLILRFDDTNPENERLEYYAAIKVGLDWLGVKYDKVKNTSDDIELIYQKGLELINSGVAYVCTCKQEVISKNRREMKSCKCSTLDQNQNNDRWKKMFDKFKAGEAIVRFRGNMSSENTVMRDPVLFRIIDGKHPLLGDRYRVWPSYDFAVAIEDNIDGVTHAFRTKEYELRSELYYAILDALKLRKPKMMEFSRLEFKGMPVSKRVLKPLIESGKVSWYDDPRLPTLEALKRRGITPEAIRKFVLSLGFTKADTLAPFDVLESFNRKIVDEQSTRLFMVKDPKRLVVTGLPASTITIPNHPTKDLGKRDVTVDENFYLSSDDTKNLKSESKIRLIGIGNVQIKTVSDHLVGQYVGDELIEEIPKIQWVSQKKFQKLKIQIPKALFIDDAFNEDSLEEIEVYVEPYYLELKEGSEIQFVRFGYCRKESASLAIFTHK